MALLRSGLLAADPPEGVAEVKRLSASSSQAPPVTTLAVRLPAAS